MEDRCLRKKGVDQIDEGQQVLFKQLWKEADQGFAEKGAKKYVRQEDTMKYLK